MKEKAVDSLTDKKNPETGSGTFRLAEANQHQTVIAESFKLRTLDSHEWLKD